MVTQESDIKLVTIPREEAEAIEALAKKRGILNRSTLVQGEGNAAGYAGEYIVGQLHDFLTYVGDKQFGYDFVDANGTKYDVKSKGNNKYFPRLDWDCTVPEYQVKDQDCDVYIFTRIAPGLTHGWVLGSICKADFERIAVVRKEGSQYNNAGRATRGNHLVVPITSLTPIDFLGT